MKIRSTKTLLCAVTVSLLSIFLAANAVTADDSLAFSEWRLFASDAQERDFFGRSVSVSGDTMVVGAPRDFASTGAAYVFRFDGDTWVEEATRLTAGGDAGPGDSFGESVSISGDTMVVGAFGVDSGAGAAYVFRFDDATSTWFQEQKLTAGVRASGDSFGDSVSINGDTVVVGASGVGGGTGAAYVFRFDNATSTWEEEDMLLASDRVGGDWFGDSVSVSDDTVVVGAPGVGGGTGAAYVFRFDNATSTWEEEDILLASDGVGGDSFGDSASVSDDTVVAGAPGDEGGVGAAYVFRFVSSDDETLWVQEAKLTTIDAEAFDLFGGSVSVSDDTVVVGAFGDDGSRGAAYVFTFDGTTWIEDVKLTVGDSDEAKAGDLFGWSVSVSDDTVVAGAPGDDVEDAGEDAGAAYVFRFKSKPKAKKIDSSLGKSGHRRGPDWDVFTFTGGEGEEVTITLEVDPQGENNGGERATLIVKNRRGCAWLFRIVRGAMPSQITATLPGDCKYFIGVFEQPRFLKGNEFRGEYCITLESSGDAYDTLEPTCWVE